MHSHSILKIMRLAMLSAATVGQVTAQPEGRNPVSPTPFASRWNGYLNRQAAIGRSLVANVTFRSVGPTVMSGRVTDVDADPSDPSRFYVAYASGGLWYTANNGQSFTPVFDDQASMTIGDIAVDWAHGILWVGTGESNSSRSSYAGTGIYKSVDSGATWIHAGLGDIQHTGRIVLHPDDPAVAWVAATGHLFSPNRERGVYKTSDGGVTWTRTLYVDDNTGAIDLVIDPGDPAVLYAALWHRERRAWNFVESGSTSGIYKSTDGGETWACITGGDSGFSTGDGTGRIGLAVFPGDPRIVYAVLDNQARRPKEAPADTVFRLTRDTLRSMTAAAFLALDDTVIAEFLRKNEFDEEYSAARVKNMVRSDSIGPRTLVEYLEDANSLLFDTEVTGAEVYRSDDGGSHWRKTHADYLNQVFNTYGYYFGHIRVSPTDPDKVYIAGVPLLRSTDGGRTFASIDADNMHGDFHAQWIDPHRDGHMIIGNDGGLNITYDDGTTYFKANSLAVGQFYSVQVDDDTPYNIYGGLQDNGVWTGSSTYRPGTGWQSSGRYPWKLLLWGDGMQVMVDTRDNNTVYTGYQFGYTYRVDKASGRTVSIKPHHKLGERPLRFNWQTPIWLSRHNQDILYMGSNRFHRSMNRGDDFRTLSGDLTRGGRKGDVPYGTLTTIHESPLRFGLLYAGSDDGLIHVSFDAGYSWKRISDPLPGHYWVKRVVASAFDTARVYACLNGHAWDNFDALLYVSENNGKSWRRLGRNLPAEPLNVVREDPFNPNILYVGSDNGLYVSLDRGERFMAMTGGLPAAPVHDLVIQPRSRDLVVGTHGRSIYVACVRELEQLTDTILNKDVFVFAPEPQPWRDNWGSRAAVWKDAFEPKKDLCYFVRQAGLTRLSVRTASGLTLFESTDTSEAGLNYFNYGLTVDSAAVDAYRDSLNAAGGGKTLKQADNGRVYLVPGKYVFAATTAAGRRSEQELVIREKDEK